MSVAVDRYMIGLRNVKWTLPNRLVALTITTLNVKFVVRVIDETTTNTNVSRSNFENKNPTLSKQRKK